MAHYKGAASEGSRAANLMKQRERQKEELEFLKKKIAEVSLLDKIVRMRKNNTHFRSMERRNSMLETSLPLLSTLWRSSSSPVLLVRLSCCNPTHTHCWFSIGAQDC